MTAIGKTCFEFECDGCGSDAWSHHEGVPHFGGMLFQAEAELVGHGWVVGDGKHWCPECAPEGSDNG